MRFYLAFLCATALIVVSGCNSDSGKSSGAGPNDPNHAATHLQKLGIQDVVKGTGPKVEKGDEVWVTYVGKLANGTIFDETKKGADPFHVSVGSGGVIKGWDLGLVGMQKGGKRKLSIPYSLGYNDRAMGEKIPPFSDLYFDIEVVDLLKASDADVISANDVKVGTGREVKDGDTVTIDYDASVGGKVVESTKQLGKSLTLKVGADSAAVRGFDDALKGMKVGGERKIQVPPGLTVTLQSDAMRMHVVVFDVHLISIK